MSKELDNLRRFKFSTASNSRSDMAAFGFERPGRKSSHLGPQGSIAVAMRRNASNIFCADLGK
eukprot:783368-Pyramimonas_sp.AAC.1